ncbi:MAG: hypothetical protein FWF81_02360 [Defluviitaleaceae bacterium]|nr:hypothetical protein [Defluviitaleaceae bacterium]
MVFDSHSTLPYLWINIFGTEWVIISSILEEFARGNISPDVGSIPKGSHYERTMKIVCETEDRLVAELNDELKDVFRKHVDAQAEATLTTEIDRFIYGYRLGVLMTMEVFKGRDDAIFGGKDS